MPFCEVRRQPDGAVIVACYSGSMRRRKSDCVTCDMPVTLQCDFPVDADGKTCDNWMCKEDSIEINWGRDHCLNHDS